MRRAYSVHEMHAYLERRSEEPALARRLVTRLKSEKLIDDARYALEFARQHARSRKQGRHRITRELRTRGVPDRHIGSAIEQTFAETDEALLVQKLIERKLRSKHATPLEPAPNGVTLSNADAHGVRHRTDSPTVADRAYAANPPRSRTFPRIVRLRRSLINAVMRRIPFASQSAAGGLGQDVAAERRMKDLAANETAEGSEPLCLGYFGYGHECQRDSSSRTARNPVPLHPHSVVFSEDHHNERDLGEPHQIFE